MCGSLGRPLFLFLEMEVVTMSLCFDGPTEGWSLTCGNCGYVEYTNTWQSADVLIMEAESDGWSFEQFDDWDGVSFADGECAECNGTNEAHGGGYND